MVVQDWGITNVDVRIRESLGYDFGSLYLFFSRLTEVLAPQVDAFLLLLTGAGLALWRRTWAPLLVALSAIAICAAGVLSLKYGIARPSPSGLPVADGGDFPSGHTASALVLLGTIALLITRPGRVRALALAVVAMIGMLVGAAVVYDGFHWFSDALASCLMAPVLLWLVTKTPFFPAWERDRAGHAPARRAGSASQPERPADDLLHDLRRTAVDGLHP